MADNTSVRVIYTSRANSDAIIIKNYLLYKFTQKEVDKFYNLLSVFESVVVNFPQLYPNSPGNSKVRRAVLSKKLSVFYIIIKNDIAVVAIMDNRMSDTKWP